MKVICLTGGLASGKSTASRFLAGHGAAIIDADQLGHRAYDPGLQAYRQVIEAFGDDIVDNDSQINRAALGSLVFGDPAELKKLTDIVWPQIRRLAELELAGLDALYPDGVVVFEAAVLFEAGWEDLGDEVWAVVVEREVAIERAMQRDDRDRASVEDRLNAQLTNEERAAKADAVIDNSTTLEAFEAQLEEHWQRFSSL